MIAPSSRSAAACARQYSTETREKRTARDFGRDRSVSPGEKLSNGWPARFKATVTLFAWGMIACNCPKMRSTIPFRVTLRLKVTKYLIKRTNEKMHSGSAWENCIINVTFLRVLLRVVFFLLLVKWKIKNGLKNRIAVRGYQEADCNALLYRLPVTSSETRVECHVRWICKSNEDTVDPVKPLITQILERACDATLTEGEVFTFR